MTVEEKTETSREALGEGEVHTVLSNGRRELTLRILREGEGSLPVRDLAERIAARETGEQPPPRNIRQSVYVSLLQTHLPKLDTLDVVEFDNEENLVSLGPRAADVYTVMESDRRSSSGARYGVISVVGLLILGISNGLSLLDPVVAAVFAGLLLLGIAASAGYRASNAGWPTLQRFRGG